MEKSVTDAEKLVELVAATGHHSLSDFISDYINEPTVPGVCCNPARPNCNYTAMVAPDMDAGFCQKCRSATVRSGLRLAHIT